MTTNAKQQPKKAAAKKSAAKPGNVVPFPKSYGSSERVEQVIQFILEGIKRGQFAPGQRIAEAEIADALDIKRAAIREGLRILTGQGVIELTRNRGARIRRLSREALCETITVITALNDISIALASKKHTTAQLKEQLHPIMASINTAAAIGNYQAMLISIAQYHQTVHELGKNKAIFELWTKLHIMQFQNSIFLELPMAEWDKYLMYFRRAHSAVCAGSPAAARKAFKACADHVETLMSAEDPADKV